MMRNTMKHIMQRYGHFNALLVEIKNTAVVDFEIRFGKQLCDKSYAA